MLLIYLPNIISAQWNVEGNSGLPEGVKNFLGTHDNVSVRFITNNIERMRLAPNGNFGIGTNNPQQLLHVNGAIRFQNLSSGTQTTAIMLDANGDLSSRVLNITNWNTAFSWGNHADENYLTAYTETDPVFIASPSFGISSANITNWDAAYSWGNHATAGYLTSYAEADPIFTAAFEITNPQTGQLLQYNGSKWQNFSHNFISEYQDLIVSDNSLELTNSTSSISLDGINYWSRLNSNLYYNSGSESTDGLLIRSYNNNATISLQEFGSLSLITKKPLRFKMQQNGNISIGTHNTNYFTVIENGNVGVGTDEPAAKLEVNHQSSSNQNYSKAFQISVNNTLTKSFVVFNSVSNEEVFRVWGNGSVNAKGIYAQQFKVKAQFGDYYWPDYVFNDDYILMDLSQLKSFIIENQHLPNVPSKDQVAIEGVDLGEMTTVLLQKIEELTLYIINQDEQIKELINEMNILKEEQNIQK